MPSDLFGVGPAKQASLSRLMAKVGIRERDLTERFVRSSGPGGQNVNKVATCVQLLHRPSGLKVKVSLARSRALNRFLARRVLAEKLEAKQLGVRSAAAKRIHKIRRQKNKRSKRAKEKMLAGKKRRSRTKKLRRTVSEHEE